jgi:hypothetical protein
VKPEEYDQFHEMILLEECSRTACYVSASAYAAGLSIGLPPVLDFGSKYLKDKVGFDFFMNLFILFVYLFVCLFIYLFSYLVI